MGFSFRKMGIKVMAAAVISAAALVTAGYLAVDTPVAVAASSEVDGEVKAVAPVEVCMVNDKVFGRSQIPVEFDGKTYYGCCAGCVERITNDRGVRYSVDPVSGAEVDKAAAIIIEGPGGEALYFESFSTAQKYMTEG